ncbi:MAG: cyanophycinase, partial [Blastocatellia bacterium]
ARFISMLADATGVFFSGGDQNRIMDILADQELLALVCEKYWSGTPTSAGAAVMSDPMMTGEADLKLPDGKRAGIRSGLGLIPGLIIDQHFLVRQRHNRLFGLLMRFPGTIGIGIDEDTAVAVEDNRTAQVFGKSFVMFAVPMGKTGSFSITFLAAGEVFELKRRRQK